MNINQLPAKHYSISSMINPVNSLQVLHFVVTEPEGSSTYWDIKMWFCEGSSGDVISVIPYEEITDPELKSGIEAHVENNPDHFAKPPVINPVQKNHEEVEAKFDLTSEQLERLRSLDDLADSNLKIRGETKKVICNDGFIDALTSELAKDPHFGRSFRVVSWNKKPFLPGGRTRSVNHAKQNTNVLTIMGLLARANGGKE